MLIIDMPMPKYCADCPMIAFSDRGMICLCTEALLEIDYDKKRPSWCPIKGELVRCRERKWFDGQELCDRHGFFVGLHIDTFFCADGERRTDEQQSQRQGL